MIEKTFAMIKPDAIRDGHMVDILQQIEKHGFVIKDMMKLRLSPETLVNFYQDLADRPFFADLISFMSSGPVVALTLERENAIAHWRFVMGSTDPKQAAPGTIRNLWGSKTGPIMWNCVHGSDSAKNVKREIRLIDSEMLTFGDVPEDEFAVHAEHCCAVHGCKYGEETRCPVVNGVVPRSTNAGWCQEPGLVDDPETCRREGERMPGPDYHT